MKTETDKLRARIHLYEKADAYLMRVLHRLGFPGKEEFAWGCMYDDEVKKFLKLMKRAGEKK